MEILEFLKSTMGHLGIVGVILTIGSLIRIKPLQINVWSWLARKLGNTFNHDQIIAIDEIKKKQIEIESKLDSHISKSDEEKALERRQTILVFCRQILQGINHTKEEYLNILQTIDDYDSYCIKNPDFPNNRAVCAKNIIIEDYQNKLKNNDFLVTDTETTIM